MPINAMMMKQSGGGGGGGGGPYLLLNHAIAQSSSGSSGATTVAKDTTGANLIVLAIAFDQFRACTVSDSKGNTWTAGTLSNAAPSLQNFYCYTPTTDAAHTFSVSGGSGGPGFSTIAMLAFSGANTPTSDQFHNNSASSTTVQPGSITPTLNNEVVVAAIAFNVAATQSIDSGFTKTDGVGLVGGIAYGLAVAYLIQTTATAENPTWTIGTSGSLVTSITSYFGH